MMFEREISNETLMSSGLKGVCVPLSKENFQDRIDVIVGIVVFVCSGSDLFVMFVSLL
jgi:hypothetical protein